MVLNLEFVRRYQIVIIVIKKQVNFLILLCIEFKQSTLERSDSSSQLCRNTIFTHLRFARRDSSSCCTCVSRISSDSHQARNLNSVCNTGLLYPERLSLDIIVYPTCLPIQLRAFTRPIILSIAAPLIVSSCLFLKIHQRNNMRTRR